MCHLVFRSTLFRYAPFKMGKFSNACRGSGVEAVEAAGGFGTLGTTCPFVWSCSCNFLAGLLSSPCATLPWKTGWWGCAAAPNSSLAVLVVQKGSSGGPTLVSSGERHANRSPPLVLPPARPRCHGIVCALESVCCWFLCWAWAIAVLRKRTSGQNRCALFGLA